MGVKRTNHPRRPLHAAAAAAAPIAPRNFVLLQLFHVAVAAAAAADNPASVTRPEIHGSFVFSETQSADKIGQYKKTNVRSD
jgi:hypothetical protein